MVLNEHVFQVKLPYGYSAGPVLQTALYLFTYGLATPVALNNIYQGYKNK